MFGATTTQASHMYLFAISFLHSRAPEGGHVTQITSAVESADPMARNSWGCKFCKKTQILMKSTRSPSMAILQKSP